MQLIQENTKLLTCRDSSINDFFFQKIKIDTSTPLTLIMTLSHGQTEVFNGQERGFNNNCKYNNLILKDNSKIDPIDSRCFINSYMIQKEIQAHEMPITPQLMKSVNALCDRYHLCFEEQKKDKVQKEIDSKKQEIINELLSGKGNCHGMQD